MTTDGRCVMSATHRNAATTLEDLVLLAAVRPIALNDVRIEAVGEERLLKVLGLGVARAAVVRTCRSTEHSC